MKSKKSGKFGKLSNGLKKFFKVYGIIALTLMVLGPITSGLAEAVKTPPEEYTITGLGENGIMLSGNDGNTTEYDLMGCILTEDADISYYIGKPVFLEFDSKVSKTSKIGLPQCYIVLKDTSHILQLELIADGIATFGNMEENATQYQRFWECSVLGRYPD